jgi:hypothetical protein
VSAVHLLRGVFGIEEPLSIFSIHIENIEFFNIDSSIYGSSILRNIENIEYIENVDMILAGIAGIP